MRILHITQSLDPAWGGIARVLPMLATELSKADATCRIAVLAGDRFGTAPDVPGVEVLRFAPKARSPLGSSPEFNRAIGGLVEQTDVVHLHGLWAGQNWSAGAAARKQQKPFIMTAHSMMMPWGWRRSAWKKRPIGWLFEHRNLRTAARLHALAEGEAAAMRALGFNDHIEVIPNGLHTSEYEQLPSAEGIESRFPNTRGTKWVLILGRLAEQKGIIPAMQACFDALSAGPEWHLVVAGPDQFGIKPVLEAAIGRKGLTKRVTFTGMIPQEDVRACLGRASILLQPSLSEGLSMSILEALASGLPVLISPACNLPEVKQYDAGRIVEPQRRVIASALNEMIRMPEDARKKTGQRGRELAREKFDWAAVIPKYLEMYRCVMR